MKRLGIILCVFGIIASGFSHAAEATGATNEIQKVIEQYSKSIDAADTTLAAEIWDTSQSVTFIHPRGHERGWEKVKENFYGKTMGANFTERKLTVRDVTVHVLGDSAWAEFYWEFNAKHKDGNPMTTKGRETQVFRKTQKGWRIVHVHYSGMPRTGQREGF